MRRGVMMALSVMGAVVVILAIAVASVGTDLDETRIERDDLQFELDDLRLEVDAVSTARRGLQAQTEEQLKTIEQLKAQLDHLRSQAQQTAPSAAAGQ